MTLREAHQGWITSGRSHNNATDLLLEEIVRILLQQDSPKAWIEPEKPKKK